MTTTIHKHNSSVDEVIREVRRTKESLARLHDFDVHRIAADARSKQAHSGHRVVSRSLPRAS